MFSCRSYTAASLHTLKSAPMMALPLAEPFSFFLSPALRTSPQKALSKVVRTYPRTGSSPSVMLNKQLEAFWSGLGGSMPRPACSRNMRDFSKPREQRHGFPALVSLWVSDS